MKVLIVGAGTAGLVIAKNLQDYFNVTVIEKSKYRAYPIWYKIPLLIGLLYKDKKNNYIRKKNLVLKNGRRIPFFESNLFGGTSVMNGGVHVFGAKSDWGLILDKFDSSYSDLFKSYSDLYSLNAKDKDKITLLDAYQSDASIAFIETLNAKGIPLGKMDLSNKEGCGPILNTIRKYFRTSVLSILGKRKFKLSLNENVEGLLFSDDGRVAGVRISDRDIFADYVILSGGVIGTCDLLLREQQKGGASNLLDKLDIGKNVQDHTNLRINILTNKNINSLNEISGSLYKKLLLGFKHFIGRPTLMMGTGATTAAHLDLDRDGVIDTRIHMVQFSENGRIGSNGELFSSTQPGFSISITVINPASRGEIKLDGLNNTVDPMYLSSQKDVELLKIALKFCIDLIKSQPLSQYVFKIENEDEIVNNPEEYISNNIFSGYHLIGGTNEVIKPNFEVKNTKGLYVCDASVFSRYAASNIHSSVVLIADIFSKKFLTENRFKINKNSSQ
jgi:choline dehydrogenase-like flavoprotein